MKKKVYFAGSIRGGRADAILYADMIRYIQKTAIVLTEHIGNPALSPLEEGKDKDALIYQQDTNWLREADMVIAECTNASLGVGYELAYAEAGNIPCYVFYNKERTELSAMINGNPYFTVIGYSLAEEIYRELDRILEKGDIGSK